MSDNEIKQLLETFSLNNLKKLETWLEYDGYKYINACKLCRLVIYINKTNYRRDSFIKYVCQRYPAQNVNDKLCLITEFVLNSCPPDFCISYYDIFEDLFYPIYESLYLKTDLTEDELEFVINYFANKIKCCEYTTGKRFNITNDYEIVRVILLYKNKFTGNAEKIKTLKDRLELTDWDYECISNDYLNFISKYDVITKIALYKLMIKPIKDENLRLAGFVETLKAACDDLNVDEITISKNAIITALRS